MLEYASRGNLFNYIKNTADFDGKESILLSIYTKVCKAVAYMHSKQLIHRDIKPENILLDEHLNPKLCDFGWATELKGNECRKTFCGTYEYMAPEIFETESYDSAVDIWSLGILLYEILHRKSPFAGSSIFNIYKNIIKEQLNIRPDIDPLAASLIARILKPNPKDRPKIEQILDDPFIKDLLKKNFAQQNSMSPCKASFISMSLSTEKFQDPALAALLKKSKQAKHYSNNFDAKKAQQDYKRWNLLNKSARDISGSLGGKKERRQGEPVKQIHFTGKNQSTILLRKAEGLSGGKRRDEKTMSKNRMYGSLSQNIPTSPLPVHNLSNNASIREEMSCSESRASDKSDDADRRMPQILSMNSQKDNVFIAENGSSYRSHKSNRYASNPPFQNNMSSNADLKNCLDSQAEINFVSNPQNMSALLHNEALSMNNSKVRLPIENLTVSQSNFRKILKSKENLQKMSYSKTQSANLMAFKTLSSNKIDTFNAMDLFSPKRARRLEKSMASIEPKIVNLDKQSQLKQLSKEINKASFAKRAELIKLQNNRKAFSKSNFFKDFSILDKSQHNITLKRLPSMCSQPNEPPIPIFANMGEGLQPNLPNKPHQLFTPNINANKSEVHPKIGNNFSHPHSNRNLIKNLHNYTSKNFDNVASSQFGKKNNNQYMSFIPKTLQNQNGRTSKEKTSSPAKPLFIFDNSSKQKGSHYLTSKTNNLKSPAPNLIKFGPHNEGSFMKDHSINNRSKDNIKRERPLNSASSQNNTLFSGPDKYFTLKKQKAPEPSSINIVIKQCFHKTKVNYIMPDHRSFATPSFFSSFKSKNTSPKNENKNRNARVPF